MFLVSENKTNGTADVGKGGFKHSSHGKPIILFADEAEQRPMVASILGRLIDYSSTVQHVSDRKSHAANNDTQPDASAKPAPVKKPQLGTLVGVYLPTIQNIFGVLLFLRLAWIVGTAGVFQSFAIVLLCCSCVSTLPLIPPPLCCNNPPATVSIMSNYCQPLFINMEILSFLPNQHHASAVSSRLSIIEAFVHILTSLVLGCAMVYAFGAPSKLQLGYDIV